MLHTPLQCTNPMKYIYNNKVTSKLLKFKAKNTKQATSKLQSKQNYTHKLVRVITNKTLFYNRSFQDAGICFYHHLAY